MLTHPEPLSAARRRHVLSVARYAYALAGRWGYDPYRAYTAGLLHDIAREMPEETLLALALENGLPCGEEEKAHPILLHCAVGALLAEKVYGVKDAEILSAIAKHTVGAPVMLLLDKIIFITDKCEPLRRYEEAAALRELAWADLDGCFATLVNRENEFLKNKGLKPHENMKALQKTLKKENGH